VSTPQPLRIALAEDDPHAREHLKRQLTRLGHQVVTAETGKGLIELCRASPPDLVVTDIRMPDLDGIEASVELNKVWETPVVLVSAYHGEELLARVGRVDHVLAYLVKPVKEEDVRAAVHLALSRFRQYQEVRKEAESLRQELEDRKLVERAKEAVMRRLGLDEWEAFRRLKRLASTGNCKVVEVAREVLAAEEVFRRVEGGG
jgi:response regulator NasT